MGRNVEGHCICTECWVKFMYHGLRQHSTDGRGPPPLACPLCRGTIDVPDIWGALIELPPSWQPTGATAKEPIPCLSLCTPRATTDRQVWWQRPDTSSTDSEASEGESTISAENTQGTATCESRLVRQRARSRSPHCPVFVSNRAAAAEVRSSSQDLNNNADCVS